MLISNCLQIGSLFSCFLFVWFRDFISKYFSPVNPVAACMLYVLILLLYMFRLLIVGRCEGQREAALWQMFTPEVWFWHLHLKLIVSGCSYEVNPADPPYSSQAARRHIPTSEFHILLECGGQGGMGSGCWGQRSEIVQRGARWEPDDSAAVMQTGQNNATN